jgi:TRAP-type uncharacterized transport system substrate-binding protein
MRPSLRLALVTFVAVAIAGAAYAGWRQWTQRVVTLRVAVTSLESDDARLANALSRWMQQRSGRFRLRPVEVSSMKEGLDAVARGEIDFAAARADAVWPPNVASALVLYKEKAVVVGLPRAGITRLSQLQDKTIGIVDGGGPDPMIDVLLRLSGVSAVKQLPLKVTEVEAAITRGQVQALARVGPFAGSSLSDPRIIRMLRAGAQANPALLGLADAEATAEQDKRYETFDIPAGSIRAQPQLPPETVTTLAVPRHLVVNRARSSFFVSRFAGEMIEAKRGTVATFPLAAQIDAPDDEASAVAPVHPGASAYFADEASTIWELGAEWGYLVFLLLGMVGTFVVWLAHKIWPEEHESMADLTSRFLELRSEAEQGGADIKALRLRFEELMGELSEEINAETLGETDMLALIMVSEMAERSLNAKRYSQVA